MTEQLTLSLLPTTGTLLLLENRVQRWPGREEFKVVRMKWGQRIMYVAGSTVMSVTEVTRRNRGWQRERGVEGEVKVLSGAGRLHRCSQGSR